MTETLFEKLVSIRRHLHQYPELSGEERETTEYIKSVLEGWGISPCPSSLRTGAVAEIGRPGEGPAIALRADIDALAVDEKNDFPYASSRPGVMHACGHDFHQTALLGAAYCLKEKESELDGLIRLIFQPSEEDAWGAEQTLAAGHLDGIQAIVGFHNHPAYPPGAIALKSGAIMAGVDRFSVRVRGRGSHAAQPHLGIDVIAALTAIIQQLQTVVSRGVNPGEAVVLSVTRVNAGDCWNVLPNDGFFEGTARTFSEETREFVKRRFYHIVQSVAQAGGATAEIDWIKGPDVTFNDPELTREVTGVCETFATVVPAEPSSAGEDFSSYLKHAPGVFAFIGSNGAKDAPNWHRGDFIVSDEALPTAVEYYVKTAIHLLRYLREKQLPGA
jgi:amidohydrolase